jgi:hypothetical protein
MISEAILCSERSRRHREGQLFLTCCATRLLLWPRQRLPARRRLRFWRYEERPEGAAEACAAKAAVGVVLTTGVATHTCRRLPVLLKDRVCSEMLPISATADRTSPVRFGRKRGGLAAFSIP